MRFEDSNLVSVLQGTAEEDLVYLARIPFKSGMVLVHSGVGEKHYNGETYLGVGELGSISNLSEDGGTNSKRLTFKLDFDDETIFADLLNEDPLGGEAELYIASLDENRRISAVELLFAGDIVDYNPNKGERFTVSVTVSDWFEVWAKPTNSAKFTDASQKALHPDDDFFSMVEALALGIDDTVQGQKIGLWGGNTTGSPRGAEPALKMK
ncbi:hypothetical protein AMBLS11_12300 [Alteromonas macleodii str. 'Black Sea 11']|nr:hypothetical protein AMBLS11_12300 [Alteromonas macleodii str. 'Black Sea 11']